MSNFNIFSKEKKSGRILEFEQLAFKKIQSDPKNDISKKYEQYILDLRKAYEQQRIELEPLILKTDLLQTERKQLMDEIEQYKMSQQEILKKYELEYQEKDHLIKQVKQYQQQIQQLQRLQIPKEFQQKKCLELQESLNATLSEIIHEFVAQYEGYLNTTDDQNDYDQLISGCLHQIEECVGMFVENLPAQSSRGSQNEEMEHIKEQMAQVFQQLQKSQQESLDLSEALEAEKQHSQKLLSQRNTAQELNLQFQTQIESLMNEIKSLKEENLFQDKKLKEYINKAQDLQQQYEEEKEKLKQELVESIKQLQVELSKFQKDNSFLKDKLDEADQQSQNTQEDTMIKLREMESKLLQETLKFDQKVKECTRLEKELAQQKKDSTKLFDEKNCYAQQLEILKEKRKQDKEYQEQSQEKMKKLKQKLTQQQQNYEIKIEELEQQLKEKPIIKEIVKKDENDYEKDLLISRQEQQIIELNQKYNDQKQQFNELKIQINSKIEENQKISKQMHMLQEKREFAMTEIKRLTQLVELQKQQLNQYKNGKQMINDFVMVTPHKDNTDLNNSMVSQKSNRSKQSTSIFQAGMNYFRPQPPPVQLQNPDRKIAEKAIQTQAEDLKSTLESVYKSYLMTIMLSEDKAKEELLRLERQINECVKKTQDLFDNIEDFLIS